MDANSTQTTDSGQLHLSSSFGTSPKIDSTTIGGEDNEGMDNVFIIAMACFGAGALLVILAIILIILWCQRTSKYRQKTRQRQRSLDHIKYLEDYSVKTGGNADDFTPKTTPKSLPRNKPSNGVTNCNVRKNVKHNTSFGAKNNKNSAARQETIPGSGVTGDDNNNETVRHQHTVGNGEVRNKDITSAENSPATNTGSLDDVENCSDVRL